MIDSFYGQRRGEDYKKGLTSELKKTLDNHKSESSAGWPNSGRSFWRPRTGKGLKKRPTL